ncbi:cytochrome P450 [Pholiota conissans]|uniref:Cytochrome P450 n=1 Tax=Pholiota conissans TaxID=109636 RepID=A0A9P5YYT5_9AGAR|nr:cytochrome P450 [Pholiota conissans]
MPFLSCPSLLQIPFALWLPVPLVAFGVFLFVRGRLRWQTLKNLRGPPSNSWLYGHQVQFYHQKDVGELDFNWTKEYGGAWKIDGCFGRNILMISDPGAIRHIVHTMGYSYPKTKSFQTFAGFALGRGLVWAAGDTHVQHRKLLSPIFTAQSLRPFYHIFRRIAAQLAGQWKDKLQENDCSTFQVLNISRGLVDTTLDIIGETVFDYHFGALDKNKEKNEFTEVLHNMFAESNLFPPKGAILFSASWDYWPDILLRYVGELPFRQFIRFKKFLTIGKRLGKDLVDSQAASDDIIRRRNILSSLVEANNKRNKDDRLSEDEVLSQVTTLLFAGHETTANSLSWILYELARHPDDQVRVREEIRTKRIEITAKGQADFALNELESLTFTSAVIKVCTLIVINSFNLLSFRVAAVDDVVPLSDCVVGVDGQPISNIEVVAGQQVFLSTCAYNRHPGVWGADSYQWRPTRHFEDEIKEKQIPIGLYSNLLTFSGGPTGCIGWRFALSELLAISVELLENFEFCAPPNNIKMLRTPVGVLIAPMVDGKLGEGTQMPLGVRPL